MGLIPEVGGAYNAGDALLEAVAARRSQTCLRCDGRSVSGSELAERCLVVQAELERRGLEGGDRVLMLVRDVPAFFAGFIGCMRGGLIPIPISTLLPPKDVEFIARDAAVRAALMDTGLPPELTEPGLLPDRTEVLTTDGWEFPGAAAAGARPEAAPARAEDPAFWLYTSGTTGEPKGAIHRHLDLPATAECYAGKVLGLGPGDRVFSAAKLFFAYGLGNALTFPLFLGAEIVLLPGRPTPEAVFQLIEREHPTLFFGVPTLYAAMLAQPEPPRSLAPLRLCVSAGEALAAALYEGFQRRFGVEILDGLGSTEMLHIFLSNRPGAARPGSSGTPVPGYEVRLVDEDGQDVADGEMGRLLAYGPSAATRYHNRPEETAKTMFAPGWLQSGDHYIRDSDGYYTHQGRSDDLMKVGGQYVSPVEVESTLAAHDAVVEAAVVAQSDDNRLVKPKAFVVLKPGREPSPELASELQSFVKERIARHKYPRWIEFVDNLPKTATGKIRRFALRQDGGSSVTT